jgi:protein-S-isoprenylcysteine O-methyltransferase Ste14
MLLRHLLAIAMPFLMAVVIPVWLARQNDLRFVPSDRNLIVVQLFVVINVICIPLLEEPQLRERFGAAYDEYCRHVPRLLPRLRPFKGELP